MWLIVGQVIFLAVVVAVVVLFAIDDRKSCKEREKEDQLEGKKIRIENESSDKEDR